MGKVSGGNVESYSRIKAEHLYNMGTEELVF